MKRIVASGLAFSCIAFPAKAEFVSATTLLDACVNETEPQIGASFCAGYIISAYENLIWGSAVAFRTQMQEDASLEDINSLVLNALDICIPWSVSEEEIIEGIVKYVESYPDLEDTSARTAVFNGLRYLYRCPE